jgi:hypothetical protein
LREKDIQTKWSAWARDGWATAAAFELKICKGPSLPFSAVAAHQIAALQKVKRDGLFYKLQDTPVSWGGPSRFTRPAPFDCFVLAGDAFVVVCWYVPRKRKTCYMIDVDHFVAMRDGADRKSMTEEMARQACFRTVDL